MIARPGQFPDWDENETDVTQPPASYVSDGAPAAEPVYRQYLNWMWNRIGRWLRRFDQEIVRPEEIFGDHQTPAGVAFVSNLTGSSLVQPAGHFTGRVAYANGIRVGATDGPARTYTASRDTYWDLDSDGTYYATEVANGDPVPAVAVGRVRVALAVSDGTSVTSVSAFPVETHKRLAGRFTVASTGLTFEQSANRGVIAEAGDLGPFDASGDSAFSIGRQIWHALTGAYAASSGLNQSGHAFYKVVNARINAATGVVTRDATGRDSYLYVFGEGGFEILFRGSGLADSWTHVVNSGSGWTRLVGLSDAGIADNQAFVGAISSAGNIQTAGEHTYDAARTRYLSLAAAEGIVEPAADFDYGLGQDAGNTGLSVTYSGAGTANVVMPVHLPDGALITGATFVGSANATGCRVWIQRIDRATGAVDSLRAGATDYDTIGSTSINDSSALTIDETSGVRTIDNQEYVYAAVIFYPPGGTGTAQRVRITYTVTQAD